MPAESDDAARASPPGTPANTVRAGSPAARGAGPAGRRGPRWRLPRPCVLCNQWDRDPLCSDCHQRFLAPARLRCPRCALPVGDGGPCGACLREPPPFCGCVALADYAFPWDTLVARFKFQQQPELAGLLADALADEVARVAPAAGWPLPQCVLPVPLSPARLAERGYNQAWELARRLAAAFGLPARPDGLQRLRDTPHQVGLDRRGRQRNLQDALWVPPAAAAALQGRHLALVDDVMTTGVTASAAAQALRTAGAASVQVWVVARTPAPGD